MIAPNDKNVNYVNPAASPDAADSVVSPVPGPAVVSVLLRREAALGTESGYCGHELSPEQVRLNRRKDRAKRQSTCACLLCGVKSKAGADLGKMVGKCLRARKDTLSGVIVESNGETARFANLMICDKFWICPECAARMSEQDKRRLNAAMVAALAKGWIPLLATYTMRHSRADKLEALLDVNAAARRWFKSNSRTRGESWQSIKKRFGIVAGVINLECTYGDENAWHPHNHEILFIDPESAGYQGKVGSRAFFDDLRRDCMQRWQDAVRRAGGDCDRRRGFSLKQGDKAVSDYIAKFGHDPARTWSIESEIAKSPAKLGKSAKGRTPFQLLADYTGLGDKRAGALFVEYARCFDAKHHLHGLTKLEKLLGIADECPAGDADADVSPENERPVFEPILELPADNIAWRLLCRAEKRSDLLAAALEGFPAVCDLLASVGYVGAPPVDLRAWLEDIAVKIAATMKPGDVSHIAAGQSPAADGHISPVVIDPQSVTVQGDTLEDEKPGSVSSMRAARQFVTRLRYDIPPPADQRRN